MHYILLLGPFGFLPSGMVPQSSLVFCELSIFQEWRAVFTVSLSLGLSAPSSQLDAAMHCWAAYQGSNVGLPQCIVSGVPWLLVLFLVMLLLMTRFWWVCQIFPCQVIVFPSVTDKSFGRRCSETMNILFLIQLSSSSSSIPWWFSPESPNSNGCQMMIF